MHAGRLGPSRGAARPGSVEAQGEGRLEVVPRVRAERDVGLGLEDPWNLVELVGDHRGDVVVLAYPDHRDEVDLAGDRVDLADTVQSGDRGRDLGYLGDLGLDEDDGGDHVLTLSTPARAAARPSTRGGSAEGVGSGVEVDQRAPGRFHGVVHGEV